MMATSPAPFSFPATINITIVDLYGWLLLLVTMISKCDIADLELVVQAKWMQMVELI